MSDLLLDVCPKMSLMPQTPVGGATPNCFRHLELCLCISHERHRGCEEFIFILLKKLNRSLGDHVSMSVFMRSFTVSVRGWSWVWLMAAFHCYFRVSVVQFEDFLFHISLRGEKKKHESFCFSLYENEKNILRFRRPKQAASSSRGHLSSCWPASRSGDLRSERAGQRGRKMGTGKAS